MLKNIVKVIGLVATEVFTFAVLTKACEHIAEDESIDVKHKYPICFATGFILAFIKHRIEVSIIRK